MATHSGILVWKIPSTEELAGYSPWDHKNWTQLSTKRNEVLVHATTWINLKKYGKRNKPSTKLHILYDSLCNESPE